MTLTVTPTSSAFFVAGMWYTFRVTAVNAVGEGPFAESIAILAATSPS
jgi:hypothetical protein